MKGMLTVFKFTFTDQVRKKSFIISTIIMVLLIVAALCIPSVMDSIKGGKPQSERASENGTFNVIDGTGLFSDTALLSKALPGYKISLVTQADKAGILSKMKDDSKITLMELQENDGMISYDYYVKGEGDGPDPQMLSDLVKGVSGAKVLAAAGMPQATIAKVLGGVKYTVHPQGKGMFSGFIPAIAVCALLFICIYSYGAWVAMSISSEKTSRVMELLITSTKPSKIVIGKSVAMGALGLLQLVIIIAASTVTYKVVYPTSASIGGVPLDFSAFTPYYAVMLILYFIFGFALYAMISAVAGSTVSNAEDARTAITPVSIVAMLSFYFAYITTLATPGSTAAVAASIVPFSAPFSMPSRILMTSVPAWQIAASFASLIVTTVFMAWVSVKLYSSAVLHYGKKLKISELIAMSRKSAL